MMQSAQDDELFVANAEIDGRTCAVTVRVAFDGIEHVGYLWFREPDWDEDEGIRDHGAIPGQSPNDVLERARALSAHDLTLRYRRALSERRRYHGLRVITTEFLAQIRYLNKVATSMRAGLLGVDEAAAEIAATERRLHEMVSQIRGLAGVAT